MSEPLHYKTVKHFHEAADCHELTFSCVGRQPLLVRDDWRRMLSQSIDSAISICDFRLAAFVYMPEHVHLLVYPANPHRADISRLLKAIKRPFSFRVKQELEQKKSVMLEQLSYIDDRGKRRFQFWQAGPGYDRNLSTVSVVLASIEYFHLNPVKRGLCKRANEWKWSSARAYGSAKIETDKDLPEIHGLPGHFLD